MMRGILRAKTRRISDSPLTAGTTVSVPDPWPHGVAQPRIDDQRGPPLAHLDEPIPGRVRPPLVVERSCGLEVVPALILPAVVRRIPALEQAPAVLRSRFEHR